MATVLNRTTKQLIPSANTIDYPVESWIINPDLSAVTGFSSKYWVIAGDVVSLMSQAERDTVDANELQAARDAVAAQMDQMENYLRAFALVMLDEINLHATRVTAILDAIDNNSTLANIRTAVALIPDVPTRTIAQLKTALRNKLGS